VADLESGQLLFVVISYRFSQVTLCRPHLELGLCPLRTLVRQVFAPFRGCTSP
jgi:hypothetical protein